MIVVRVWLDPDTTSPSLRARLTADHDLLGGGTRETVLASSVEDVCTTVRAWLSDFAQADRA